MQMRPEIQIKSVIKALTDVVLPAVDADNKLAREQAQLCIGLLGLMAQQMPLQFEFDCDELQRLVDMGRRMREQARGGEQTTAAAARLDSLTTQAGDVLAAVQSTPDSVQQMVRALRSASGELITRTYQDGEPASRRAIAATVLKTSGEQLLRDRSMLLPQGWEADPEAIPDIRTLLDTR